MSFPLYHYTCSHGFEGISKTGTINLGDDGLAWFTDLGQPNGKVLGLDLGLNFLCSRTTHRFRADSHSTILSWLEYQKRLPEELVWAYEMRDKAQPEHWYVSEVPVRAALAPMPVRR